MNKSEGLMMNNAVFVYQGTPKFGITPLPNSGFLGDRHNKFVNKMNEELKDINSSWTICVDDTTADVEKLSEMNMEAIVCASGLQKQFYFNDFPEEKIYYLDSIDYYNVDTTKAIQFLHSLK